MGDLVIDLVGALDEAGHLYAQEFAIALPHAGEGYFHGIECEVEPGRVFLGGTFTFGGIKEQALEHFEAICLPGLRAVLAETLQRICQYGMGPFSLVGTVRCGGVDDQIMRLLQSDVLAFWPTTFLGVIMARFVE